jgi:hypothetical protein
MNRPLVFDVRAEEVIRALPTTQRAEIDRNADLIHSGSKTLEDTTWYALGETGRMHPYIAVLGDIVSTMVWADLQSAYEQDFLPPTPQTAFEAVRLAEAHNKRLASNFDTDPAHLLPMMLGFTGLHCTILPYGTRKTAQHLDDAIANYQTRFLAPVYERFLHQQERIEWLKRNVR